MTHLIILRENRRRESCLNTLLTFPPASQKVPSSKVFRLSSPHASGLRDVESWGGMTKVETKLEGSSLSIWFVTHFLRCLEGPLAYACFSE